MTPSLYFMANTVLPVTIGSLRIKRFCRYPRCSFHRHCSRTDFLFTNYLHNNDTYWKVKTMEITARIDKSPFWIAVYHSFQTSCRVWMTMNTMIIYAKECELHLSSHVVVLIGDTCVGKTNILSRYTKNEFYTDTRSTVGVEFASKCVPIDSTIFKAQIWDTGMVLTYVSYCI